MRLSTLIGLLLWSTCHGRPHPGESARVCTDAEAGAALEEMQACFEKNADAPMDVLVLSGGGSHGAWGIGVMTGWREATQGPARPDFKIVTGVSTGALMAPFLFLDDKDAEATVRQAYLSVRDRDIFKRRFPLCIPFSNSLVVQVPLRRLVDRCLTEALIDQVASHSEGGRRVLLVGTVDLDSGQTRVWNLSRLARSRSPARYACFREIVFASASMPVIAAPVFIDGHMHVDGGAREQLFLRDVLGPVFAQARARQARARSTAAVEDLTTVYVVVNGQIDVVSAEMAGVQNHILPIVKRTFEVLVTENKIGNLLRVEREARAMGAKLQVSAIPREWSADERFDSYRFDPKLMAQLAKRGTEWAKANRWSESLEELRMRYEPWGEPRTPP